MRILVHQNVRLGRAFYRFAPALYAQVGSMYLSTGNICISLFGDIGLS